MNKYSIIIPVYNCEKYIIDCLKSIYNQKNTNYEVIIVDDGSTDKSNNLIKEFIVDKKNFYLYTNTNHGVSYSRNFGIKKAKNDYIIFLDADDILDKHALSTYDDIVNKYPDFDLIQCGYKKFTDTISDVSINDDTVELVEGEEINNLKINLITDINYKNHIIPAPFCKLYKRTNIINNKLEFNQNFNIFEDGIFNFEYLFTCKKIYFSNLVTYHYRVTQGESLSKKSDSSIIEQKVMQCKYIHNILNKNKIDKVYYYLFIFNSISSVLNRYIYNSKNKFSMREKKRLVNEILQKDEFNRIKDKKIIKYLSMKKKVLYICIKFRLFIILNILYSMKEQ